MLERATHPSRLVRTLARWGILLGMGGTILGSTTLYSVLFSNAAASERRGPLMLSAALLSIAFVLAPFVRRIFKRVPTATSRRSPHRTLLDELRERPQDPAEDAVVLEERAPSNVDAEGMKELPALTPPAHLARLITAGYALFGATLLLILWTLDNN